MPTGTLRINDMDFILNGPQVKYNSSSQRKTEKSKFKENNEFQVPKTKKSSSLLLQWVSFDCARTSILSTNSEVDMHYRSLHLTSQSCL